MTDQSLKPNDNQLVEYRGRARGLIAIREEMRRERNRLWISTCQTPGHGRAATLALLNEMVTQNAKAPGFRHPQPIRRGFSETSDSINNLAPSMGRVRARNLGPHPHGVDPHLDSPIPGHSAFAGSEVTPCCIPSNRAPHLLVLIVLTWI